MQLSWGFYGHKKINELAVYTLPEELFEIYRPHLQYLIEHAVSADKRRYLDDDEAVRHYMDAEAWQPLDSVPKYWNDAVEKYGLDSVKKHGILPWHLSLMCYSLTEAFESRDLDRVLYLSGDIGHYLGDLHVPLHTTRNYNGQLTNQEGIHALWESRVPEIYFTKTRLELSAAGYISHLQDTFWSVFRHSHSLVEKVLSDELKTREKISSGNMYVQSERGASTRRDYSIKYAGTYHKILDGMVEQQMQKAANLLGSVWYTCWVNAGQPDSAQMQTPIKAIWAEQKDTTTVVDSIANNLFKLGKFLGRHEHGYD